MNAVAWSRYLAALARAADDAERRVSDTKTCRACRQALPLSAYYKNSGSETPRSTCKRCANAEKTRTQRAKKGRPLTRAAWLRSERRRNIP